MKKKHEISDLRYFRKFSGAAVFVFSFLWFYHPGEYVLIANQDNSLFITSFKYFNSFLDHPGGIIEYAGIFISQFLRFRLIGAIIISGLVTLSYFAVCYMSFRISDNKQIYIIGILTPILLIGMHNHYPHQVSHSLGFIIIMLTALLIPVDKVKKRIFLVLSLPVIYFICGGYLWLFAAVILTEHYVRYKKIDIKLITLIIGYSFVLIILAAKFVFLYPVKELLIRPFPYEQQYGIKLLQYIFVLWIILLPWLMEVLNKWKFLKTKWGFSPVTVLSLLGAFLILNFTYKKKNDEFFIIEKFAIKEEWDNLLKYADKHPSMNLLGSFYTNIAMANKGLLCSRLFNYPQPFGKRGLCFEWAAKKLILKSGSDFFWTINFVNEAHHWAFESFIVEGFTARNLKRLIQTELVRGNYKVAAKYINMLDRTLFDKSTADHYRKFLNNRDAIEKDPELGPRININISMDFFADGIDLEKNLRPLLANDLSNCPAFDYLMALLLLDKQVDEIAKLLPSYLELNNGKMPSLLDESLLIFKATHRINKLQDVMVSQNTRLRFDNYITILGLYKDQKEAARALYPSYKNSFWFYMNFSSLPKQ